MEKKVAIISDFDGSLSIDVPELKLKRSWERKGAVKTIDFEVLQEALYDAGVDNMFKDGYLYIEDMETKIALGLEPEGAVEPTNIIVLNDKQKENLLKNVPDKEFKYTIRNYTHNQLVELAKYAISHEIMISLTKNDLLLKVADMDVINCIKNLHLANEAE